MKRNLKTAISKEKMLFIQVKLKDIEFYIQQSQFEKVINTATNLLDDNALPFKVKEQVLGMRALGFFGLDNKIDALSDLIQSINIYETYDDTAFKDNIVYKKASEEIFEDTCLRVANIYIENGDIPNGEIFLKKIPPRKTQSLNYKKILVFLLYAQDKYNEALEIINELLNDPECYNDPAINLNRGSIYFNFGNYNEAKVNFEKSLELDPNYMEARLMLIQTDIHQYKLDSVEEQLSNIPSKYRRGLFFEIKGTYYLISEEYDLAELNFQISLRFKNQIHVMCNLSTVYKNQGKMTEYKELYKSLKSTAPDNFFFRIFKMNYCYFMGKNEQYKYILSEFKKENIHSIELLKFEIESLIIEKEYNSAIDLCNEALKLYSLDPAILQNLGKTYLYIKEYELAFKYLNEAYSIYTNLRSIKTDLGNYYFQIKEYNKAIEYYKAEKNAEKDIRVLNNIAASYYALEDYDNSIEYLYKAIDLNPFESRLYMHLGLAYYKKQDYFEVLNIFSTAIAFNPSCALSLEPYLEEIASNLEIEESANLIKQIKEVSLNKKQTKEEASKANKLNFKIYRTQTELEKTKAKTSEKLGWGDKYPEPGDSNLSKLYWNGYEREQSRIYGWLDEESPDIAKLDDRAKERIRKILKEGKFTDRVKNQQGIKQYDKYTVAIKPLGSEGIGNIRIIARRVKNANGETIFPFNEVRYHGRG